MTAWSAEKHWESGLRPVAEIEASPLHSAFKPRVSFDLAPPVASDEEGWCIEPIVPEDALYFASGPNLNVFNSKSPEGKAAVERMLRQAEDMSSDQ